MLETKLKWESVLELAFFDRDVSAVDVGDAGDIANASDRQHSLNDAFIEAVF